MTDNNSNMDRNKDKRNNPENPEENNNKLNTNDPNKSSDQGRASFSTGSTTQGGSNHGQGSSQLAGSAYEQGESKSDGANYQNEADRFGDTGTQAEGHNTTSPTDATTGFAAHMTGGKQNTLADEDGGKQSGGGATGYDVNREQKEINKEQEKMHGERDLDDLNIERGDPNTNPDTNPGKDTPATPGTTGQIKM